MALNLLSQCPPDDSASTWLPQGPFPGLTKSKEVSGPKCQGPHSPLRWPRGLRGCSQQLPLPSPQRSQSNCRSKAILCMGAQGPGDHRQLLEKPRLESGSPESDGCHCQKRKEDIEEKHFPFPPSLAGCLFSLRLVLCFSAPGSFRPGTAWLKEPLGRWGTWARYLSGTIPVPPTQGLGTKILLHVYFPQNR